MRELSPRRRAIPAIAENCLPAGECRDRGGIGTKHAWPQADGRNKWQFAESVKLVSSEPAFRPRQHGISTGSRQSGESLGHRRGGTRLGADEKAPRWRPAYQKVTQFHRRLHLRHIEPFALLGRLD